QLQHRVGIFAQDDFKATERLTLNVGLRWAYTSPLVEKDNRQSNFDLTTGQEIFAKDGSIEDRALYKPYYKGFEPRLGAAWKFADKWVARGGYGISQYMEGTGANLRLPLNPPFFFESAVNYDATTGPGTLTTGFAELKPLDKPSGQVRAWDPNLRPQFTQQWNVFAEYLLTASTSANIGYVGNKATHLVTPVEGNQPLPGVGDPSTWAPLQNRRPLFATAPLITNISTTASRGRSDYKGRSEEHTSELQSRENLVCRLLLEKKKYNFNINDNFQKIRNVHYDMNDNKPLLHAPHLQPVISHYLRAQFYCSLSQLRYSVSIT